MSNHLEEILFDDDGEPLSHEQLLGYLQNKISEKERLYVEQRIQENPFIAEAIQGLETISNKKRLPKYVSQLNKRLHKNLTKKKQSLTLKTQQWQLIAIVVVIALCMLCYCVFRLLLR